MAALFQRCDEGSGLDQAEFGMVPARQRFGTEDTPTGKLYLGLEIWLELLFAYRVQKLLETEGGVFCRCHAHRVTPGVTVTRNQAGKFVERDGFLDDAQQVNAVGQGHLFHGPQ